MNILVDARALVAKPAGIAAVIVQSIKFITRLRPDVHFRLLAPAPLNATVQESLVSNHQVTIEVCPIKGLSRIPPLAWSNLRVPKAVKKYKPDLFWSPFPSLPVIWNTKTPRLITVHDVVHKEFQETMTLRSRVGSILSTDRAINEADLIWANSNYTKESIGKYYPVKKCNEIFVGCSVDTDLFKINDNLERDEILREYGLQGRFLLFVGSLEPRKNLPFLLSLMPELYRRGMQLLVVGGKGWKNSSISATLNAPGFPLESVVFAKYVTNEQLAELYNVADCYVSTSINEGFGLPQLEALMCGCPVVTSHNSAMIEVVDGVGRTVKGWDKDVWINTIMEEVEGRKSFKVEDSKLKRYDWTYIVDSLFKYIGK